MLGIPGLGSISGGEGGLSSEEDLSGDESFRSNLAFSLGGNRFIHKGVGGHFSIMVVIAIAMIFFILRKK